MSYSFRSSDTAGVWIGYSMCTALRSTAFVAFLLLIFRGAVRLLTLLIVLILTTAALWLATLASLLVLLIALIGHFWLLDLSKTTRRCRHTFLTHGFHVRPRLPVRSGDFCPQSSWRSSEVALWVCLSASFAVGSWHLRLQRSL